MRIVMLLLGLALAGCAAADLGGDTAPNATVAPQASAMAPAPGPQAAPAPAPAPEMAPLPAPEAAPPPALPPAPFAAPANVPPAGPPGRSVAATRPPAPPPEPKAEPEQPMTHERASSLCWMKYEDGRKKMTLDQRADLVDKCVKATMRGEKPK